MSIKFKYLIPILYTLIPLNVAAHGNSGQDHYQVAIIGDSLTQGTFSEAALGEPVPGHYGSFFEGNLLLMAKLSFQNTLQNRTLGGQVMGDYFRETWLPNSYATNEEWGLKPHLEQQLDMPVNIDTHAVMGATGASIQTQLDKLFASQKKYDLFIFFLGANDYCSLAEITMESFTEALKNGLSRVKARFPQSRILVVDLPPIHKMDAAKHANGESVDHTPIDYSELLQGGGLASSIAGLGLLPQTCKAYKQSECPYLDLDPDQENTVKRFNEKVRTAASEFTNIEHLSIPNDLEISAEDLAFDCFHPSIRMQQRFIDFFKFNSKLY